MQKVPTITFAMHLEALYSMRDEVQKYTKQTISAEWKEKKIQMEKILACAPSEH